MITHKLVIATSYLEMDTMTRKHPIDFPATRRSDLAILGLIALELARRVIGLPHVRAVYSGR